MDKLTQPIKIRIDRSERTIAVPLSKKISNIAGGIALHSPIGLAQFERINDFVEMRRRNARLYSESLKGINGITLPIEKEWAKNVYWMYSILVEPEFGVSRVELMASLEKKGVETRSFFIPMNEQPVFRNMHLFKGEKYPVAEELSNKGLYLPSSSGLNPDEIAYVCDSIIDIKNKTFGSSNKCL
jgi:perosamine synthetase